MLNSSETATHQRAMLQFPAKEASGWKAMAQRHGYGGQDRQVLVRREPHIASGRLPSAGAVRLGLSCRSGFSEVRSFNAAELHFNTCWTPQCRGEHNPADIHNNPCLGYIGPPSPTLGVSVMLHSRSATPKG